MPRASKKEQRPIYNRLRVLRAETSLSRAELADRVGVNLQTIGALERGDHYPSLDLAMSISEVFSLPVEAVFSRTPMTYSPDIYASEQGVGRVASLSAPDHRKRPHNDDRTASA